MAATPSIGLDEAFAAEFLGRIRALLMERDVDAILELATDDVIYDDVGADSPVQGKAEMSRLYTPVFGAMEALELTLVESFLSLDRRSIAANWIFDVSRSDGETRQVETVDVYTFRDDKISHWKAIFRHMDWMGDLWP